METELVSTKKYGLNKQQLRHIIESKQLEAIAEAGGIEGIAKALETNTETGINSEEASKQFVDRVSFFGKNEFDEPPSKTLAQFFLDAIKEPILILLLVFSIISIVVGVAVPDKGHSPETGWIEGFAIFVAVILVSSVTAFNDWSKEKKFKALNRVKNDRLVKVLRSGKQDRVSITTIQVGEVVILDTGDWVPADGIFLEGHELSVDESAMTGEPDQVKKNSSKPFFLSGCQIATGTGKMLVLAVGMNSEWGITYSKLVVPRDPTPLQDMLAQLAKLIGYMGMTVAAVLFIVQTITFIVNHAKDKPFKAESLREFITFILLCITIVVVAVPEGLPLAVTISLAYSMKSMLKDNNLVRHLAACETMGGATNICSDKTGTLTENRMTVTNVWLGGKMFGGEVANELKEKVDKEVLSLLARAMDSNSSAFLKYPEKGSGKRIEFIGSKTECALLVLSDNLGYEYNETRKNCKVITLFPFSSERKRMSTLVESPSGSTLFTKGASEIILGMCSEYIDERGKKIALTDDERASMKEKVIEHLASEGLRTLTIAYKELDEKKEQWEKPPEEKLTLIAIVGIQDPLRPEVPPAIEKCKTAGITVRMVTGDNILTATRIAKDCGILDPSKDELVMEGPTFRALSDSELDKIIPRLRVLARSSPSDKHRLVKRLRHLREVVAVTGDGTNDGPALKAADVGMAMGIAGTEIAKEASDIIIMDDNFASIVKAVMWGRAVRGNIQKFLQFQLTVNVVALAIAFVMAAIGRGEPLSPIQLLWVNLIQDTFAALALATEPPTDDLLQAKPAGRRERLITPIMWRNIVATAAYELFVLFGLLFAGDHLFTITQDEGIDRETEASTLYTMVFNTFVYMQLVNEINARRLDNRWNAFSGFFTNFLFLGIVFGSAAAQGIIVSVGGTKAFRCIRLDWRNWLICLGLGLSMVPFGIINRVLIPAPEWNWLKYQNKKKKKSKKSKKEEKKEGKEEEGKGKDEKESTSDSSGSEEEEETKLPQV